jgi:8-oxo-dGTP pyrophosphatase MutT (NUDIX family)
VNRDLIRTQLKANGLLVGSEAQRAALTAPGDRSDFDLHPHGRPGYAAPERKLKPAGVLVPIINRPSGPTILLTQRTAHLNKHAGQISFPGGGWEEADSHLEATALRETEEEIGLHNRHIEVLGQLSMYETSTAYGVTPVVGWVEPPFDLTIDPFEVAEAFEVPLAWILERENHQKEHRVRDGRRRHYYVLPYEGRFIWGATAGMLVNLVDVLEQQG